jgi:cytochrome c oxidase subunit 2
LSFSFLIASFLAFFQGPPPQNLEHRVANIFRPLGSPAEAEKNVALLTFAITGAIFVVVGGLIIYTMVRFRRRQDDTSRQEPPQVYGSNQIETAWTIIPILIVFVLIGVSARVIASVENASPPKDAVKIEVIGHQWWWEVRYPDYGFTTANEVHFPVTTAAYLTLASADVNHNFWVPQLSGKVDLIPNRLNYMWLDAREAGTYLGNCAEYCGTQHANMLIRVMADTPEQWRAWTAAQQKPAAQTESAGRAVFESLSCVNCHAIRGTHAIGKFGPDLTHLMSRQTIGSGVLPNTPENLRAWVDDPQQSKPGCLMPSMKLTKPQLDSVMAYLETLK